MDLPIAKNCCHELLIAKFRLKLKKVGKTTRPFRYDLNQIPYNYTMEMTNRFKGLDQIAILLFCISFIGDGLDPCLLYNVMNL